MLPGGRDLTALCQFQAQSDSDHFRPIPGVTWFYTHAPTLPHDTPTWVNDDEGPCRKLHLSGRKEEKRVAIRHNPTPYSAGLQGPAVNPAGPRD